MKIHEYQGKELLKRYGVRVPRGIPCFSVDDAVKAAQALGGKVWVVKAQIHAGGRGKGGGVKVAKSLDEVRAYATQILGMQLVTHQTGPSGQVVRRLLIEEGADIKKELYVGLVVDRVTQKVTVMASSEGGMDIEEVAEKTPDLIHKVSADVAAVAHLRPVAVDESAVNTVSLAPTAKRAKVSAPVPGTRSPLASIAVAIELVTVTVPDVPPPLIPTPAVTPSISPVAPDATQAAPS